MRVPSVFILLSGKTTIEKLAQELRSKLEHFIRVVNGNIGYGDGTSYDNVKGQWIVVETTTADLEVAVDHTLGMIPVGMHVMLPPESGTVNKGATPWTTTQVFLSCSAANQTFTIFLLPDSSGSE